MAKDYLGLFDTPPSRAETRLGLVIVGLLFFAVLVIFPVRNVQWAEIQAFVPSMNAAMFVANLIIATLLYAQAVIVRSRALTFRASGYVFIAALLIPYTLTFPGAFAEDGLLGAGPNSTAWMGFTWRAAFPAAVLIYVWLKQADVAVQPGAKRPRIAYSIVGSIIAAAGIATLTTLGHDLLPPYFVNRIEAVPSTLLIANGVVIFLTAGAIIAVFRSRRSVLDGWLVAALAAWLMQSLLNLQLQARFTIGFYTLFMMMMVATVIMLLALVAESSRLYVRLALSTSAQTRERDARLMSMNAMAAASFQEVGQPLSAMLSSAMASKGWLTRPQPDREKAIESLDDAIAAAQRTFEMMKSVRTRFTDKPGGGKEFCINGVVRETALSMDRELAARKLSLQFDLDESLPAVLGDRTQIQRVLSYLMAKLFESPHAEQGNSGRILLRTAASDGRYLILDLSDSENIGTDEEMEQLFESVFDAKDANALGLSLCKTIIEDHAGYLFVSQGTTRGTMFRLKLPLSQPLGEEA